MKPIKTITVVAQKDYLERLASVPPIKALSELIWNGLDAGSDLIEVEVEQNKLSAPERIRVRDYGTGIPHEHVVTYFGDLGNSWKSTAKHVKGRTFHGSKGEGRFKAFALGNLVEWNTVYKNDKNELFRYQVIGRGDSRDKPTFNDPVAAQGETLGTEVTISSIEKALGALVEEGVTDDLSKQFAAYLSKYPKVEIHFNGILIDPASIQDRTKDLQIDDLTMQDGSKVSVDIRVIEWKTPTKRVLHLCDSSGACLHEAEAGVQIRAPGFQFSAFIKTDHFKKLDKEGLLIMEGLSPDLETILKASKKAIRGYFRKRLAEQHIPTVERWKQEEIYPYEEKEHLNPVEEAERQVFDIIAVKVESYLPDFDESDHKSKQFVFRLLKQALHQNPESLQEIITEVLKLKPKEQTDFADLIKKTSLQSIITSAKTVANRLDFLKALDNLLFDKETKKKLLERDQLHKILEEEAWLFDENFTLSGSEERLEEVLEKHIGLLGERIDGETSVVVGEDKTGRIDLRLSRAKPIRSGEMDYLVVELKRPSKKIDDEVITQIKKYAMAVAGDERFHGVPAKWKFVAISNEMNDYAKQDSNQPNRPRGLVWESEKKDITVWVCEWAEVINTAKAKLDFVNESLNYQANRQSSRAFILEKHAKYVPNTGVVDSEEQEEDDLNKEATE